MTDSFLVYDGGNRVFRGAARQAARVMDDIRLVPWRARSTRRFLEAQFGDHLFAFVLIDSEAGLVHAGGESVRRLLRVGGAPPAVADMVKRAYTAFGGPLGRVIHGRPPADIDGTFPVVDDARPHLESLRRECSLAACDEGSRSDYRFR